MTTSARTLLQRVVKGVAATLPASPGTVVLIYHRVGGDGGGEMRLTRDVFREQLALVAGRVGTLDQFVAGRPEAEAPSRVVVTVDDGTADFADEIVPALVDLGVPATVYVATDFVESQRPFPDGGRPLTWSALADCLATGLVSVGSHTHTHALLDRVTPAEASDELDRSSKLIEDRLGVPARHFAYPKALLGSPAAEAEVRRRFATAAIAGTRPNRPGRTDPHRLHRSPIQRSDSMRHFERKVAGGMRFEDDLRRFANRVRYRGRVN
jgi:peptidoglycan/xylan/chitin deacetylase (PgdA/CDA1 family)